MLQHQQHITWHIILQRNT